MLIKIHKNRTVSSSGTWGTKNENNYEILNFEFPKELEEYNKRIVYYLDNQKVWDPIINNKAILTNAITTKGSVKAYIWCTKSDEAFETDVDFRTQIFVMKFFENDNADGIVPTPEQVDGFNTMLTAMNEKIEEIDELETTIKNAETQRQENEETRQNNEKTRQENEQTRQNQEAERERRTDKAIADIKDKTAEYNQNAEAKTTAFNNNATQKTNDFNSNYTQKVNDFNTNASSKKSAFNSNASSKTSAFNSNATNKTNDFNSNATSKTTDFNTNAENKTTAFNDNATQKTTNFDNNASEKTDEFNTNAQNKINEYDEHIVEYQEQIDELQEEVDELSENMPWNKTEQATEISVDDAAKYSKNKMKVFGNTEQTRYSGYNLFDLASTGHGYGTVTGGVFTSNAQTSSTFANVARLASTPDISLQVDDVVYISFDLRLVSGTCTRLQTTKLQNNSNTVISKTETGVTNPDITNQFQRYVFSVIATGTDCKKIYVQSRTADNAVFEIKNVMVSYTNAAYEPYVGGVPSPNPDYPQPIHVVTGNNTISIGNTNYPINLGSLELCKIGNYQDYLYKENGNWYKYGALDKYVYNKDLSGNGLTENIIGFLTPELNIEGNLSTTNLGAISLCNMLKTTRVGNNNPSQNTGLSGTTDAGKIRMYMSTIYATTYAEAGQLCADNNLTIYFGAKVPVITQITDTTLISQLDAIYEHFKLVKGTNNISVTAEDLAPYMQLNYMQDQQKKFENIINSTYTNVMEGEY